MKEYQVAVVFRADHFADRLRGMHPVDEFATAHQSWRIAKNRHIDFLFMVRHRIITDVGTVIRIEPIPARYAYMNNEDISGRSRFIVSLEVPSFLEEFVGQPAPESESYRNPVQFFSLHHNVLGNTATLAR
jgi:hypothetical protein